MPSSLDSSYYFKERARETGLDFVHDRGSFGRFHVAEITCGGGGFLDYDGDGDLDVYLAQGSELGPQAAAAAEVAGDRLYRNELVPGGTLEFTDVSAESGVAAMRGYGCGPAVGDYDNDGRVDLLVMNLGPNRLLHNEGGGRFRDVTAETAPALLADRSSVAAAFFDYDRDGWLDLFVANYVRFEFVNPPRCYDQAGAPDYCGPTAFANEPDQLFHNLGRRSDGRVRLEEVTGDAGLGGVREPGLGLVTADFDGDGWLDVYVANDGRPNLLWINRRDGTFTDEAVLAGCSVNSGGAAEASMGVDAADLDGDGDLDLFMTHLIRETNTLYLNDGQGFFEDRTLGSGLGPGSLSYTSFGTGFFDYDNDGWLDLLVVSGAVTKLPSVWSPAGPGASSAKRPEPETRAGGEDAGSGIALGLPNQLFRNLGAGGEVRFADVTAQAGPAFEQAEVSRGASFGDVDDDGDVDVMVVNNGGPVRLLINEVGNARPWLGLRLVGGAPARDQLGARVALLRRGEPVLWRRVRADGGYNASQDPRVLFGLGDDAAVDGVRVLWPDGSAEDFPQLRPGRYTTLRQGTGAPR